MRLSPIIIVFLSVMFCMPVFGQAVDFARLDGPEVFNIVVPSLNDKLVPVYEYTQESGLDIKRFYVFPYFDVKWEGVREARDTKCMGSIDPLSSISIPLEAQFYSTSFLQEVKKGLVDKHGENSKLTEESISLFVVPITSIRIIVGYKDKNDDVQEREIAVIGAAMEDLSESVPQYIEYEKFSAKLTTTCAELKEIIDFDDIKAEVIQVTQKIERNTVTAMYSGFKDWFVKNHIDRNETQRGGVRLVNKTHTKGAGFSLFGHAASRVESGNQVSRVDNRSRTVSGELLQDYVEDYIQNLNVEVVCQSVGEDCDLESAKNLINDFVTTQVAKRTADIETKEGEIIFNFRNGERERIQNPQQVDQLLEGESSPRFAFSSALNVDCEKAAAMVAGGDANVANLSANSPKVKGNKNSSKVPVGKKKDDGSCGYETDSELTDQNGITWDFNGVEWIPTSIDFYEVSEVNLQSGISANYSEVLVKESDIVLRRELPYIDEGEYSEYSGLQKEIDLLKSQVAIFKTETEGYDDNVIYLKKEREMPYKSVPVDHIKFTELCASESGCVVIMAEYDTTRSENYPLTTIKQPVHIIYNSESGDVRNFFTRALISKDGNGSFGRHAVPAFGKHGNDCTLTEIEYTQPGLGYPDAEREGFHFLAANHSNRQKFGCSMHIIKTEYFYEKLLQR